MNLPSRLARLALTACLGGLPAPLAAQLVLGSSSVLENQAEPGGHYEGTIQITNTSSVTQEARVYQTDYAFGADGRTEYGAPGTAPRSNAKWIAVAPSQLVIPAHQTVAVSYVVTVPAATSLAGTYWSMVMVEGLAPGSAESSLRPANRRPQVGVRTSLRYGVQIATHVGTAAAPRVAFDSVRAMVGAGGQRLLGYDFVNVGQRAARLKMSVELLDANGTVVRRLEQQRGLLYPGTSARQQFDFGALPPGSYTALVTADAGDDEMFGAQYTVRF